MSGQVGAPAAVVPPPGIEPAIDVEELVERAATEGAPEPPRSPGDRAGVVLADPTAYLASLSTILRETRERQSVADIRDADRRSIDAENERAESLRRARKAARKCGRLLRRAPRWLRRLVRAVVTAVAAALSTVTGGATAALAVVLIALAEPLAKGLQKAGVLGEKAAKWLTIGLQVAGAALSAGASLAGLSGTLGAVIGASVPRAVSAAYQVVTTLVDVEAGVRTAVAGRRHDLAMIDAERAGITLSELEEQLGDGAATIRELYGQVERTMRRLLEGQDVLHDARLAGIRNFA
jgi:hypothetical protein